MVSSTQPLINSIPSIMIGVSVDGRVFEWNPAAAETFGIPATAVLDRPFPESGIQWNWDQVNQQIASCLQQEKSARIEDLRFTRPDGKEGLLGFSVNLLKLNQGYFLFGTDITNWRNLQAQVALSQKLESIGQLAAGIAHEINTPTQYIGDNIHFIQNAFIDLAELLQLYGLHLAESKAGTVNPELIYKIENQIQKTDLEYLLTEIPKAIVQSLEGIDRVTKIVRAMKEFSHPSQGEKKFSNINQALDSTITISRNEWKYVADLETDMDEGLPLVNCVIEEINQVVLNLIVNAADAIKDVLKNDTSQKGKIKISTKSEGDFVRIIISDTGGGIPPAVASRIFDPFFTTKPVGKGTGQGLTIAHDIIVNKHGGTIAVESEPGQGTSFIIRLPVGIS